MAAAMDASSTTLPDGVGGGSRALYAALRATGVEPLSLEDMLAKDSVLRDFNIHTGSVDAFFESCEEGLKNADESSRDECQTFQLQKVAACSKKDECQTFQLQKVAAFSEKDECQTFQLQRVAALSEKLEIENAGRTQQIDALLVRRAEAAQKLKEWMRGREEKLKEQEKGVSALEVLVARARAKKKAEKAAAEAEVKAEAARAAESARAAEAEAAKADCKAESRVHPADPDRIPYTLDGFLEYNAGDAKKAQRMWNESKPAAAADGTKSDSKAAAELTGKTEAEAAAAGAWPQSESWTAGNASAESHAPGTWGIEAASADSAGYAWQSGAWGAGAEWQADAAGAEAVPAQVNTSLNAAAPEFTPAAVPEASTSPEGSAPEVTKAAASGDDGNESEGSNPWVGLT